MKRQFDHLSLDELKSAINLLNQVISEHGEASPALLRDMKAALERRETSVVTSRRS